MKKIICAVIAIFVLGISCSTAFAAQSGITARETVIKIDKNDESFEIELDINTSSGYAGLELGVSCDEGVEMIASECSAGNMSVGPTFGQGKYWVCFFDGENSMPESVTVTLTMSCPKGTKAASAYIDELTVITRKGFSTSTEKLNPDIKVTATTVDDYVPDDSRPNGGAITNTSANTKGTGSGGVSVTSADTGGTAGGSVSNTAANEKDSVTTGQNISALALAALTLPCSVLTMYCLRRKSGRK